MKRMKMCAIFACCLALLLALTACGGSDSSGKSDSTGEPDAPQGYEGTWRHEYAGVEQWLDLEKNGRAFRYEPADDRVFTGSWVETKEGVTVTWDFSTPPDDIDVSLSYFEFPLVDDGEGGLLPYGVEPPFTRDAELEVPRATVRTLCSYRWIDEGSAYELFFNLDGSWEIYDSEYETLEEGEESGAAIDGYAITLTAMDGEELKLKLSEEGNQITGYEGMTFVRQDPLADYWEEYDTYEDEGEEDDEDDESNAEMYAAEFYGCWEYEDYDVWVDILTDGTYQWMNGYEITSGSYTIEEDELVLDSGLRFSLDESGGLIDSDGDTLFPSTWPDSEVEPAPQVTVADFVGCWEYTAYDNWICIFGEGSSSGTYDWYQIDGLESSGSCYMDGETLYLEGINLALTLDGEGGLIDSDGDTLSWSTVPDNLGENDWDDEEDDWYYEEPAAGGEGFVGCWEAATADVWLCIYDDGTFEWYEGGSLGRSSTYEIYGDEICLDMGADMWLTLDDDGWLCHETEGLEMFPSQLPDYLQ